MKKFLLAGCFVLLFAAMFTALAFADASGEMMASYNGGIIVNNTWEYIESEKTLYIRSKLNGGYNETGRISYDENGAWQDYINEIEHIVLEGTFNKCSTGAFKNHTALKDIRLTSETSQFDGNCFEGCKNLESVSVGDNDHIKGCADLSNASILRGDKHFYGTKITHAYLLNDTGITGKNQFDAGITIYAPKNTNCYDYFVSTGRYNVIDNTPVEIKVIIEGKEYSELYPYGTSLLFPSIGGHCVALYTDPELTVPYTSEMAMESVTLYGAPVLRKVGAMVRKCDYHGIRMIYQVNENAIDVLHGYEIKEFGALAIKQRGVGTSLMIDSENVHKSVVYSEGEYSGSLLSIPSGGITDFAYTAVGFEENGALSIDNADQNICFRGYIIFVDPTDGSEIVCYTDVQKTNLADVCKKTVEAEENGENKLTKEELDFINEPLVMGATPNFIYTKEELLAVIDKVYNDTEHYIPAQHLSTSFTAVSTFLNASYEETGTYPALVALDLMDMTAYNERTRRVIAECKEYIEMGGIVSFSYHMENPTGNYASEGLCRGELGGEDAWIEVMTEGTALNTRFNEILDYAGVVLNEFDKDGYPVIWRPLHENNGNWFWWCAIQTFEENGKSVTRAIDREIFIDLWEYVYHYYTDVWGLKNLVWAYSPNVTNSKTSPVPVTYGYPGDEYCDIAGTDWYTSGNFEVNGSEKCYKTLMETSGKPAALTEFGPSGPLKADPALGQMQQDVFSCREQLELVKRMMNEGLKLTYVLNWSGSWAMLGLGNMEVIMLDETALDVEEIRDLFNIEYAKRESK